MLCGQFPETIPSMEKKRIGPIRHCTARSGSTVDGERFAASNVRPARRIRRIVGSFTQAWPKAIGMSYKARGIAIDAHEQIWPAERCCGGVLAGARAVGSVHALPGRGEQLGRNFSLIEQKETSRFVEQLSGKAHRGICDLTIS